MRSQGQAGTAGGGIPRERTIGTRSVLRARNGSSWTSSESSGGTRFTSTVRSSPSWRKRMRSSSTVRFLITTSLRTSLTSARRLRAMKFVSGSSLTARAPGVGGQRPPIALVDRAIRQHVRVSVLFPRHVLDRPLRKGCEQRARAERERSQARMFDPPKTAHLLDDEL